MPPPIAPTTKLEYNHNYYTIGRDSDQIVPRDIGSFANRILSRQIAPQHVTETKQLPA